jgi:HK97 family phage major capsid protein
MTTAASVTGQIPAAQRIAGLNEIPLREPMLIQMLPSATTTSNRIEWAYEVVGEGAAGGTLEGETKNQIDADFAVGYENIIKRTVFVKISEEMLNDIDFMASYINNRLLGMKLMLDLEDQVLNGTTSTTALHGIIEQSTAWAAGTFADTVKSPNELDAVMVGANMINVAHHTANLILMHPSDITALALTKDENHNYIFPSFQLPSGKVIAGIPVMASTVVTARKFVVMDRTKATIYNREGIRVEAGYDGNDFTKNLRTIRAEARLALVIETNDKTAFVYGDFDTAIAALSIVEA